MMRAAELLPQFLHDRAALARRQAEADRVIASSLAAHLAHDLRAVPGGPSTDRPWRLDPVPLVLDGDVFDHLAAAVRQRVQGMETLLADLYGPRNSVREGWVPAEALASSSRYRLAAVGAPPPPRWLTSYALDVVALTDGTWRVVQDLTDTPTGVGYALLDRSVMARVAAELLGTEGASDLASISGFPAELRHALAATTGVPGPRIVLFTAGVDDPAYVEHSALARLLGFHLVEGPDLVVRKRRLWLRTVGGLDPIDIVYRRLCDAAVDPIEVGATGADGVPGLLLATASGGVVLANAHGSGVLEDAVLAPFWPAAVEGLTGTALTPPSLAADEQLAAMPSFRGGEIIRATVVLRLHAVVGPDGVTVMAGGNGRVLARRDDPRRPTARVAKDVWVLGAARAAPVIVAPPLPQIDLASSVPTRAADALFWVGRAAERAEAIARTARVVAAHRQEDPLLVSFDGGRWARRMALVLRVVRGEVLDAEPPDGRPIVVLDRELSAATAAVGDRLNAVVASAATVGEYLSVTTGRVLRSMVRFADGKVPIDALDAAIVDLSAFAGLWNESTRRGPAWRFGDIGRRLERALTVLGLVEACLRRSPRVPGAVPDPIEIDPGDIVDVSALEVLLAANESLVAYRRRHRSDVQLAAATELLLQDRDNPRSYAASMDRLAEHAAAIEWREGQSAVAAMAALLAGDRPLDRVPEARQAVAEFGQRLIDRWFATPVNPVPVRGIVS